MKISVEPGPGATVRGAVAAASRARSTVVPSATIGRPDATSAAVVSGMTKRSRCMRWWRTSGSRIGANVPQPTWSVRVARVMPRATRRSAIAGVM